MKITIELPDDVAARLEKRANVYGVPMETLIVNSVVARDNPSAEEKAEIRRRAYEEIVRLREEMNVTEELNIREMIEEGRRF
jgi:hypothetical protein